MENEKQAIVPSEEGAMEEKANGVAGQVAPVIPAAATHDLGATIERLREEKEALTDRLLRKQAELENFRKRTQREKEEFRHHATADLIRTLLPTLDGFDRALQHRDPNVPGQFYQGVELIRKELMDVLGRAGLTVLETVGKDFDPHLHQAVETVEAGEHRDQEIVEELQRGYKLRQRLLRPAIVKVAVAASRASGNAEQRGSRQEQQESESNR
jgi:molecular chaperone GrpE